MNVLILFVFIQRQVESFSQSILKIEWQRKKKAFDNFSELQVFKV